MRIGACIVLLLALAASLAAQEKGKENVRWRRVYTFSDAVIQMEEVHLSLSNSRRVRFRTVFNKALPLRGRPDVKYKVIVEDMELNCPAREYRVAETVFLDKKDGVVVHTYKADDDAPWKRVESDMMARLFDPACAMIAKTKV